jgi:hypothetical protein
MTISKRFFVLGVAGAVTTATVLVLPPRAEAGQASGPPHTCASDDPALFWRCAQASTFEPPRTRDGAPDFSGYWRHGNEAKEDLEEPWDNAARVGVVRGARAAGPGKSFIVDPRDGKLPMQPWAAAQKRENQDRYIDQNVHCYLSGVPRFIYEGPAYQILQSRESIAIMSEEAHAFRVIPMDGRPHVAKNIRLWLGDARGRWDGNTLVIDTTNHNGRAWLDRRGAFYTDAAKVTERLTMLDRNTIAYAATVDDPLVYTRPFTIAFMMTRHATEAYEIWEDSCFEGEKDSQHLYSLGLRKYPGIASEDVPALKGRGPR